MAEQHLNSINENTDIVETTNKDESVMASTNEDERGYESECSSSIRSDEDIARSALEVESDAFTRFIERQRLEVMFELRRLRLGERPVTGQPNRERIQTILNNAQESRQETRTPSARPAPPSAHAADINALANRRCVSAALGSAAFRQDLENTIRRSIPTRSTVPVEQTPVLDTTPQVALPSPVAIPAQSLSIERQENELASWEAITQLQREIIVLEISDLVHRQLVTSALESDFRRHLEHNVLRRLEQGAPLEEQAPTVRPIQPAPRIAPQSITNVDALSSRLDSMQQMLQLMFQMQLDMQRTLRHEVSAALAANPTTTMSSASQPVHSGHCTVCLTAIADTVLYRCGHLCVCYTCGLRIQQSPPGSGVRCPICRASVDDIVRVYRSSRDGE